MIDLNADPDAPTDWWVAFTGHHMQHNETYTSRLTCRALKSNPNNKTAQEQWAAWLMYVMNRKLLGDDPAKQKRVPRAR